MLKKISLFMGLAVCMASGAFAQTVKDNIEKRAKDPATAENAAKADRYIQPHRISNDSTITQPANNPKKQKKNCGKKEKRTQ